MEEQNKQTYKFKACPFRERHFCGACELYNQRAQMCTLVCINANLGLIAKTFSGDKETVSKIKEDMKDENQN